MFLAAGLIQLLDRSTLHLTEQSNQRRSNFVIDVIVMEPEECVVGWLPPVCGETGPADS